MDFVWTRAVEMYLYKATCPDIPTPKQKGGQKERGQNRCSKQNAGGKLYPPLVCLRSNSQVELKHLEEFLNVHTLSLQDSVRARTGMAYRYKLSKAQRDVYMHTISIQYVFGISFLNFLILCLCSVFPFTSCYLSF